jgi:tellurium resistance protein terD
MYEDEEPVRCPRCRSTQLTANRKGFGLGKAAAGGLLLGPVGLLGGFLGSSKVKITCLKCGYTWKP